MGLELKSEKINLSHQALLTERFQKLKLDISEYTFANVYLFRQIHQYEVIFEEEVFLKGITRDGFSFLMPTFIPFKTEIEKIIRLLPYVDFLFPIPEQWLSYFDTTLFTSTFIESDSDYLFSIEKIRTYPGRHLNGKRNLVKQFTTSYAVTSFPLTPNRIPEALQVLNRWQSEQKHNMNQTDYFSCQEALERLAELKLVVGHIFYADQQPCAFSLGEKLNECIYAIHFVKAQKNIKGIYQYLYQAVAQLIDENIEFLNFEQDLGYDGIRKAKQSYHPDRMVHKLRLSLREYTHSS